LIFISRALTGYQLNNKRVARESVVKFVVVGVCRYYCFLDLSAIENQIVAGGWSVMGWIEGGGRWG